MNTLGCMQSRSSISRNLHEVTQFDWQVIEESDQWDAFIRYCATLGKTIVII